MEEKDDEIVYYINRVFRYKQVFLYKINNLYYYIGGKVFEKCLDKKMQEQYEKYVELYKKYQEEIEGPIGKFLDKKELDFEELLDIYKNIHNNSLEKERKIEQENEKEKIIKERIYKNIQLLTEEINMKKIYDEYYLQLERNFGNINYIFNNKILDENNKPQN